MIDFIVMKVLFEFRVVVFRVNIRFSIFFLMVIFEWKKISGMVMLVIKLFK